LVTACKSCNSAKGTHSFAWFVGYLDAMLLGNADDIRARLRRRRRRSLGKYLSMV
jgi:hypothetical protein